MVTLDGVRLLGFRPRRLDHIGVDRALSEPPCVRQFLRFGLKHFDKLAADYLPLLFRIADALQMSQKLARRIDMNNLDAQVSGKGVHHLHPFIESQQAVIDENAGQLIADGTMQKSCNH